MVSGAETVMDRFARKRQLPCSQCLRLDIREGSRVHLSQGGATGQKRVPAFATKSSTLQDP